MRLLLAAALLSFVSPALAASVVPFHDIIAGTIDTYARPKSAAFAQSSGKLRDDVAALCAAPGADTLATARASFKAEVIAFSAFEFLQMGPLGVDDRFERLLFWPDTKGIALRQVQQTLAAKDPTAATPDSLKGKSVALQGLNAVEFLLFGTGADELGSAAGAYRCSFAAAATTLIAGIAATVRDEWADTAPGSASDAMLNPQPASSDYRTDIEVMNKIAGALIFGNDTMRDQRLSPILSLTSGTPKPRSALFWRSGMTGRALGANFAGLRELFMAAQFDKAPDAANAWVSAGILFELKNAIAAADTVPESIDAAVATPAIMLGLRQLYVSTGSLDTLDTSLGQALGLTTGFSALDGD